jgi:hypothetical protein
MFHPLNEALASFDHHKPNDDQVNRIQIIRGAAKVFVAAVWAQCPNGPDRIVAVRYIHEAMMTANKSIVLEGEVTG